MTRRSGDDGLERDLERFLAESARPIPPQVLDDVIAAVPRTSQDRGRGLGRRLTRLVPLLGTLTVVAVALGLGLGRVPPSGTDPSPSVGGTVLVWNPFTDYVAEAPGANPGPDRYGNADVWRYQYAPASTHDPSTYTLLPDFADGKWSVPGFANLHVYPQGSGLVLHPWGAISSGEERRAVVTWRSPISGEVDVAGRFLLVDSNCTALGDGISVFVDTAETTLWTADIPSGGQAEFELRANVQPGSSLSFVVDSGGRSDCDSTLLVLRITAPAR